MSYDFVLQIEGERQGRLADDPVPAHDADARGRILGLSYSHTVESRRTGPGSGEGPQARHTPIVFSKRWGPSSPQLFAALTTRERLSEVRFEFNDPAGRRTSSSGLAGHATIMIVVLTDAFVESIVYSSAAGAEELEFVSLSYRSLRIESPVGASSTDDWVIDD